MSQNALKHGYRSEGKQHPLYTVWVGMKDRCYRKAFIHYKHYGGRGISVCKKWIHDPAAFIEWGLANGWESGLTIERKNNDAGYSPGNCRFATRVEQSRNTRHTKLTLEKANQIRSALASGGKTQLEIAGMFGTGQTTVSRIKLNQLWKP